ncbi:anti-sigma factor domain-containing protein [Petrocella sp. FN5]|uniref:anti-sigma factor domain-containing protein n=1 Tax=Petrocella sp. FN5 TaxID=3032002 RepID=UPI0023DAF3A0|nr:anti-sigma factor domain-containing protein [Petrocella sp. FN5]MDF1616940.1 anti-sigma factor domain-containing protein [Petrocella sp. FN5]
MTRGLITRIEDNFMIVMTDQMTIDKIKPRINVKVGQRIEFNKRDRYRGFLLFNYKKASSMLALILVLILTSIVAFGQNGSREIYAVVSVDINPSIELSLDQSGIVVGYKSFNKDGQKILSKSLLNQDLDSALSEVILSAQDKGYLVDRDMILISSAVLKSSDAKLDSTEDPTIEEHIETYMTINKAKYQFVYIEGMDRAQDSKPKHSLGREALGLNVKDHKDLNLSTVETLVAAAVSSEDMNDENPIKIVLEDESSTYDVLTLTKPLIATSRPSTNDILALAKHSMAFDSGLQVSMNASSNHDPMFLQEIHSIKSLPPQVSNTAQENTNKKSESEDIPAPSDKVNNTESSNNNENKPPTLDNEPSVNATDKAIPKQENNEEVSSKTNEPQSTSENDKPSVPSQANENAQDSIPNDPESSSSPPEIDKPSLPNQINDKAQDSIPDKPESSNSASEADKPSSSLPSQANDKAEVSKPDGDASSKPTSESDKPSNAPNPTSKKE